MFSKQGSSYLKKEYIIIVIKAEFKILFGMIKLRIVFCNML